MNRHSFLLAALFVLLSACSSAPPPSSAGCRDNPQSCAAGTTCWPIDEHGSFACLPSKNYKPAGSDCELLSNRAGCNDGLVCVTSDGIPDANVPASYCAPYCDSQRSNCPAGQTCAHIRLYAEPATAVWACIDPLPWSHDAGTDL